MDLRHVIVGPIVTEKAERFKASARTHTLRIAPDATKVDVINALRKYYDVDIASVRVMRTTTKTRAFGARGKFLTKRKSFKKAMVTLSPKSKPFDIVSFKI